MIHYLKPLCKSTTLYMCICISLMACSDNSTSFIPASDPHFQYVGRIDDSKPATIRFSYPGSLIRARFEGNTCQIKLRNELQHPDVVNYYQITVDNQPSYVLKIGQGDTLTSIDLDPSTEHTLSIFKRTESFVGTAVFEGIMLANGKKLLPLPDPKRKMEFIGNSITCGYGNEGETPQCPFSPELENGYKSYSAITARNLDAAYVAVAYSGKGIIQNYDLTDPETLPIIYDRIIPKELGNLWKHSRYQPDAVVINLGTNDFAHNAPDSALFEKTYWGFLQKIRKQYPKAHLFCIVGCMMRNGHPNGLPSLQMMQQHLTNIVQQAKKQGDSLVYTFSAEPAQNGDYGCDWHPNVARHEKMAKELTEFIRSKTGW